MEKIATHFNYVNNKISRVKGQLLHVIFLDTYLDYI